jgi:hypothetical protein
MLCACPQRLSLSALAKQPSLRVCLEHIWCWIPAFHSPSQEAARGIFGILPLNVDADSVHLAAYGIQPACQKCLSYVAPQSMSAVLLLKDACRTYNRAARGTLASSAHTQARIACSATYSMPPGQRLSPRSVRRPTCQPSPDGPAPESGWGRPAVLTQRMLCACADRAGALGL